MKFDKLSRSEIEEERWNQCVLDSEHFRHYGLTYYLDAACEEWFGLIGSDYSWVWPLPTNRAMFKRIFQPLLAQQLGPFGRWKQEIDIEAVVSVLSKEYWSVNMKFNESVQGINIDRKSHRNIELSLQAPYEELRKRFNRNVVSNLKKAERNALIIEEHAGFDPWLVDRFKSERGKSISELNSRFYEHVEGVYKSFSERGEAVTFESLHDGNKVAGVMILKCNHRLLLFFSHSTQIGRNLGAMHALLNHVIKTHAERFEILDFEGSNDEKLAFFYSSFGGEEKVYLQVQNSKIPWPFSKLIK